MHNPAEQAWDRDDLWEAITVANVADLRQAGRDCAITLSLRHPDIPEGFSHGTIYLHATPGLVWEAIETYLPSIISHMETRISDARRSTLPSGGDGRPVPRAAMVEPCLVCGSRQW